MTDVNQVRINELARELEVKAKAIIDLLPGYGVTEKKTHSSSIPADVAEGAQEDSGSSRSRSAGGSGGQSRKRSEGRGCEGGKAETYCACTNERGTSGSETERACGSRCASSKAKRTGRAHGGIQG